MTAQKVVIHQQTSSEGLSSLKVLSGGGSEYNAMVSAAWRTEARHPPQRDEVGGENSVGGGLAMVSARWWTDETAPEAARYFVNFG